MATRNIPVLVPGRGVPQSPVVIALFRVLRVFRVRGLSLWVLHAHPKVVSDPWTVQQAPPSYFLESQ